MKGIQSGADTSFKKCMLRFQKKKTTSFLASMYRQFRKKNYFRILFLRCTADIQWSKLDLTSYFSNISEPRKVGAVISFKELCCTVAILYNCLIYNKLILIHTGCPKFDPHHCNLGNYKTKLFEPQKENFSSVFLKVNIPQMFLI